MHHLEESTKGLKRSKIYYSEFYREREKEAIQTKWSNGQMVRQNGQSPYYRSMEEIRHKRKRRERKEKEGGVKHVKLQASQAVKLAKLIKTQK
jgi:hypothetical protein